ncbi:protein of unknown function [Candidatus Nitrosocosmicus franklandus]|uniref:Uncharacterized protein n=1 Tax=Candidatus Nitrosocosmicus franklandianus TaxID=1798806 RepID=A0A484I9H6_9ARCH|nr:protein of unknown function [Candidatus Nitrosocosmicus franklandus]
MKIEKSYYIFLSYILPFNKIKIKISMINEHLRSIYTKTLFEFTYVHHEKSRTSYMVSRTKSL